jgi:hypothetical protein
VREATAHLATLKSKKVYKLIAFLKIPTVLPLKYFMAYMFKDGPNGFYSTFIALNKVSKTNFFAVIDLTIASHFYPPPPPPPTGRPLSQEKCRSQGSTLKRIP